MLHTHHTLRTSLVGTAERFQCVYGGACCRSLPLAVRENVSLIPFRLREEENNMHIHCRVQVANL